MISNIRWNNHVHIIILIFIEKQLKMIMRDFLRDLCQRYFLKSVVQSIFHLKWYTLCVLNGILTYILPFNNSASPAN